MLIARIDKFSHFFMVTKIHPSFFPVIKRCLDELIQIQYVKIRGRVQKQATKVFAASNKQRTEFRFHINYFDRFCVIMKDLNHGGGVEIYEHELYEPKDTRHPLVTPSHMKVRDYQEDVLTYCREPGVSKLISLATGRGKMSPLNTDVRIPNGWKKMGDIVEGDILSMPNGDEGKILNIFDFDDKPLYRFTFADDRISECGEEHVWWVYSEQDQYTINANEWTMMDTKQLYEIFQNQHYSISIPLVDIFRSADKELNLPIDPYQLGVSLAKDKFKPVAIPEEYLNASFKQRLALIQGLINTRGEITYSTSDSIAPLLEYSVSSQSFAEQLLLLFRSIGLLVSLNIRPDHIYPYQIATPYSDVVELFQSKEKGSLTHPTDENRFRGFKLPITKVEKLDKRTKARCIAIDHPDHAYITNDYVVTHNTFTSLKFAEGINQRLFIVVLARYIEKWQSDVIENFGKDVKLHLVKGGADFYRLLDLAKQEYEMNTPLKKSKFPDVVLVSSNTFQRFLTSWEQATHEEREEMICPHEIFEYMGTGLKILDEAHQHFHLNFKMDLYQHMPKAVYLTATLESNDSFMQRMYQLMWPLNTRDKVLAFNKYDIVHPILYRHNQPERIRCVGGQGYSHVLYEQSIKRHKPSRRQYLDMIGDVVEDYFLPVYAKGRKMLIFCSLVETCELVSEYLLKRFKDQKWQISRFVAGDPKEVIDTNDITVSTLGKAGTALDIPGLIQVLMTVALSEPKANLQAKGRNRDLSSKPGFEGITPKFFYFVGTDLPKHWQYHKEKETLFKDRTLAIQSINTPYVIGEPMDRYLSYQGNKDNGF